MKYYKVINNSNKHYESFAKFKSLKDAKDFVSYLFKTSDCKEVLIRKITDKE